MARPRGRPRSELDEIFVKVARSGGEVKEVLLNSDRTVQDALNAADLEATDSDRIRVEGQPAELDDELKEGDVVTLSGKIEGGN